MLSFQPDGPTPSNSPWPARFSLQLKSFRLLNNKHNQPRNAHHEHQDRTSRLLRSSVPSAREHRVERAYSRGSAVSDRTGAVERCCGAAGTSARVGTFKSWCSRVGVHAVDQGSGATAGLVAGVRGQDAGAGVDWRGKRERDGGEGDGKGATEHYGW